MKNVTFAISLLSTQTGNGYIDVGLSDYKTAIGAAKSFLRNNPVLNTLPLIELSDPELFVIVRPIESAEDRVNSNFTGNVSAYIRRAERYGETVLPLQQILLADDRAY